MREERAEEEEGGRNGRVEQVDLASCRLSLSGLLVIKDLKRCFC